MVLLQTKLKAITSEDVRGDALQRGWCVGTSLRLGLPQLFTTSSYCEKAVPKIFNSVPPLTYSSRVIAKFPRMCCDTPVLSEAPPQSVINFW